MYPIHPPLTLSVYQDRASATADPRAFDLEYLIPGIVGEVGELFGQRAKAHWHGWDREQLNKELVSEFGDICWQTAILLKRYKVHAVHPAFYEAGTPQGDPWLELQMCATNLNGVYSLFDRTDYQIEQRAQRLWVLLESSCQTITGHCFRHVLEANLAKLADRQARGVKLGQGDHR